MLGERLAALERKLEGLEREREYDGSPVQRTRSAETHTCAPSQIFRTPESPRDKYDVVDGMGSVALTEGGDEHEYFGKPYPLSLYFVRLRSHHLLALTNQSQRCLVKLGIPEAYRPRSGESGEY